MIDAYMILRTFGVLCIPMLPMAYALLREPRK